MSGVGDRSSVVQRPLQRMLCIVQNFPLLRTDPSGNFNGFEAPTEDEKAKAVAKVISELGDKISKKSGQQIVQIAGSKDIAPSKKANQIYKVLKPHFPHLKLPEKSQKEVDQWKLEQHVEAAHQEVTQTLGQSERLPVKDSYAYRAFVEECGIPPHIAENLLYRVKIGNAIYTFIADLHDADRQIYDLTKIHDVKLSLLEKSLNKQCVFFHEGSPENREHYFSLENDFSYSLLKHILHAFSQITGKKEIDYRQIVFVIGFYLCTSKDMRELWDKLLLHITTKVEHRALDAILLNIRRIVRSSEDRQKVMDKIPTLATKKQWTTILKELASISLTAMKISEAYRSSVETLLKDPDNKKALAEFSRESAAARQEIMAETLFANKLPGERYVLVAYHYIPDVIANLKRLAKSGSGVVASPDLDQKEKSSEKRPLAKEDVPAACVRELQKRIPDSNWGRNAAQQKVWYQGTEEDAKEIGEYLKDNGIAVDKINKDKNGNWFVVLSNPDFSLIEKLPSFEGWKKRKPSKEKDSSQEDVNKRKIGEPFKTSFFRTQAEISQDAKDKEQLDHYVQKLEKRVAVKWITIPAWKTVLFEGTEKRVKEVAEYLKEYCINITEPSKTLNATWKLILKKFDFEQIDYLPSFEYWQNKKKSEEIEPSDKDSLKNEIVRCSDELENRLPDTKWKKNPKQQKVWFEGTKERAKEIRYFLKVHCIKAIRRRVENSDNYVVMLTNPDLALIEKLPTFEQWLKKNAE